MTLLLQFHVVVSLIGLASGFAVVYGLLGGRLLRGWTSVFLATTILTSATGFLLPPFDFDPARGVGAVSLVLLALAVVALYLAHLKGAWRLIYVVTAIAAFYLNVVVAVIQAFSKVPTLQALAPTQSEPPFLVTQIAVLVIFVALGVAAGRNFHPKMVYA